MLPEYPRSKQSVFQRSDCILRKNRYTCIDVGLCKSFPIEDCNCCLHAFIAHDIRILSHCAEKIAIVYQLENHIRLVEAYAHDVKAAFMNSIANTNCRTLVCTKESDDTLRDEVSCCIL